MLGGGDRVPLSERAWVPDVSGGSGALVAADGTLDWWCPSGLTGAPAVWKLLDPDGGGLRVGPPPRMVRGRLAPGVQRYDPGSLVLRTILQGRDGGRVEVVDLYAGRPVRIVTALTGPVDVEVDVALGRAWRPPRRVETFEAGVAFDGTIVHTGMPMTRAAIGERVGAVGSAQLAAGDHLVVTVGDGMPFADAADLLERAQDGWRRRAFGIAYGGPYLEAVDRSVLAVLALLDVESGGVAGAATTSMPRTPGDDRVEDRRWCRFEDAAAAFTIFRALALEAESDRVAVWLEAALDHGAGVLAIGDRGGDPPPEPEILDGVAGWRGSPVVVGAEGGAASAAALARLAVAGVVDGNGPLEWAWPGLVAATGAIADGAEDVTDLVPGAAVWTLLRRMSARAAAANPLDLAAATWHQVAVDLGRRLDTTAKRLATLPVTAADLDLTEIGPWPPSVPVVEDAVDRVLRELGEGPYVHRAPGEGASLVASFHAVTALARLGRWDEAHERMGSLVGAIGPSGLIAEDAHPISQAEYGNLPCVESHLAVLQAALALEAGPR